MALENTLRTDMATLARHLQAMGRGRDKVLAHITPEEARLLKARGGRGSTNPATGLLEFEPDFPVEGVTVTAPAYTPSIDTGALAYQGSQQKPQTVQDNNVEGVTVTANAAPATTITSTPDISSGISPLTVPQATVPPAPAAPLAAPATSAAPEQVTVSGQSQQPQAVPTMTPPGSVAAARPEESTNKQVKDWLGNNSTLLSILGLGGLGLLGARTTAGAGQQAGQLQQNLAALGTPLQQAGQTALDTTLRGGLTPDNMQALQAAQAQIGAGQARGAVSAQQASEAIAQTYAGLLQKQLNEALTLLNTADQYLQNAYIQGYNANVANQTNTANFYTNLAQMAARLLGGGGNTTITIPAAGG